MSNLAHTFTESAASVAALGVCSADISALDDARLLAAQTLVSAHRRQLDLVTSWVAAEIAHRSRREFGDTGLAQRSGFSTPESLIQSVSGATRAEAVKFVSAGSLIAETEAALATEPDAALWQAPLVESARDGDISLDAVEAIRRGLGDTDDAITGTQLREATQRLLGEVVGEVVAEGFGELPTKPTADQLFRRARDLRDELDANAVARREKEQHDQRYLKIFKRRDGMVAGSFLYGPEDGALLLAAVDQASGPKRGGPRFVDPAAKERADAIQADPRTPEQLNADAFIGLIRVGIDADPAQILGAKRPAVRVMVKKSDLEHGTGHGLLENTLEPVSIATVERHICESGILSIQIDDEDNSMNVGREKRLFQHRQRIALAARDGGCMHPDCDRPASWAEAHHINPWSAGGKTDLADGILFCRRHHLDLHNNGWSVVREGTRYWMKPPGATGSGGSEISKAPPGWIELVSKNPLMRELRAG
jgi:hypothetical protein